MKRLLFFFAFYCGHCKQMLNERILPLQKKFGEDKVRIYNVQEQPLFAEKCGVKRIPALFFIHPLKHVYQRVDHYSLEQLEELLNDSDDDQ